MEELGFGALGHLIHDYAVTFGHMVPVAYEGAAEWIAKAAMDGVFGLALGLVLIPDVLETTPAYVDSVMEGSAAATAQLRPDDLILLVDGRRVESQRSLRSLLRRIDRRDVVELTIQRGNEILPIVLRP